MVMRFSRNRKYYNEEQIVALGWKTDIWLGYGRLVHALTVPAVGGVVRDSTEVRLG